jgi:hypothetical protein
MPGHPYKEINDSRPRSMAKQHCSRQRIVVEKDLEAGLRAIQMKYEGGKPIV